MADKMLQDGDAVRSKAHNKLGRLKYGVVQWYDVYGESGQDNIATVANDLTLVDEIQEVIPEVIVLSKVALEEELEQLEFLMYSYNRNIRHVNNKFRFRIEEIEAIIEDRKKFKMSHLELDEEREKLLLKMISTREYHDMKKVDQLMDILSEEDSGIITDRYQYRESLEKIGKGYHYSPAAAQKRIRRILKKLIKKM